MGDALNFISLEQACREIRKGVDGAKRSPFFFIVGAGVSVPSVPLARDIVSDLTCKLVAEGETVPSSTDPMERYSDVFRAAHPQRADRQRHMRALIEGKTITRANLRLAHLVSECTVTNLVVTPNFDPFLSRALERLGSNPIVCDHPRTVGRLGDDETVPTIVHVHGTVAFYDLCNLTGEIVERGTANPDEHTISQFLQATLDSRSPLVVGYSGWEKDVIMSCLKRRLNKSVLRQQLYWFCYTRAEVELLPEWLKAKGRGRDGDVCFVVPNELESHSTPDEPSTAPLPERSEPTLDAATVFERLSQQFDLKQPALFNDPLGFLVERLREFSLDDSEVGATYFPAAVVERVEQAKRLLESQAVDPTKQELEKIYQAIRESRYLDAAALTRTFAGLTELSGAELRGLLVEAVHAAENAAEGTPDVAALCEWVELVGGCLLQRDPDSHLVRRDVAKAQLDKGINFGRGGKHAIAVSCFVQAVETAEHAEVPELDDVWADAMLNLGVALGETGDHRAALGRFKHLEDARRTPAIVRASAALNRGVALWRLGDVPQAVEAYDVALRLAQEGPAPNDLLTVTALFNKGVALTHSKLAKAALEAYAEVELTHGASESVSVQRFVARAMVNSGALLAAQRLEDQALDKFQLVARRYSRADDVELRLQAARALSNAVIALNKVGRPEVAATVRADIVSLYLDATEPELRQHTANALAGSADEMVSRNSFEEAVSKYDELLKTFGDDLHLPIQLLAVRAMCARGKCLLVLERYSDAEEAYRRTEERLATEKNDEFRIWRAESALGTGAALLHLGRHRDALAAFERARSEAQGNASQFASALAGALFGKATMHEVLGELDEALQSLDEMTTRFSNVREAEVRLKVAIAYQRKVAMLAHRGENDQAIAAADEFLQAVSREEPVDARARIVQVAVQKGAVLLNSGRAAEAALAFQSAIELADALGLTATSTEVARAMLLKATALDADNRQAEAELTRDSIVARFADSTDVDQLVCVTSVMFRKASNLDETSPDLAVRAFDDLVDRFWMATAPELRQFALDALNDAGFTLLKRAKRGLSDGSSELGHVHLKDAKARFARALSHTPENSVVLGNLAYTCFLLGEKVVARDQLRRAMELGGDVQRQRELDDTNICPIAEDVEFREMINAVWAELGAHSVSSIDSKSA